MRYLLLSVLVVSLVGVLIIPAYASIYDLECSGNARCISGTVTKIVDGDTIHVDGQSIRFALASTPELNEFGGIDAKYFVEQICPVGSEVLVDEDDGQTEGSYGRVIAVIYCNGINLNEAVVEEGYGYLASGFCYKSEFSTHPWAQKHGCSWHYGELDSANKEAFGFPPAQELTEAEEEIINALQKAMELTDDMSSYSIQSTGIELVKEGPMFTGYYSNDTYAFSFFVSDATWRYYENFQTLDGTIFEFLMYPVDALSYEEKLYGFNPLFNTNTPLIGVDFENISRSAVPNLNAEELEKYVVDVYIQKLPNIRIINSDVKNTSWGWIVTVESTIAIGALGEQLLMQNKVFVFKDRQSYDVGYGATAYGYYDTYYPVFENVVETLEIKGVQVSKSSTSKGGGCLIATAAFGSEMAPQVQLLREIRDNTILQTESGSAFMTGFNQFYYSFSPYVADYERENPAFKETVKIALTPLLTSLTLLQYVDIDSESEMLGYGIGVILLNIGMYFVAPAVLIMAVRKRI